MRLASTFIQGVRIRVSSCTAPSLSYFAGSQCVRHAHYRPKTYQGSDRGKNSPIVPGSTKTWRWALHQRFFPPPSAEGKRLQADIIAGTVDPAEHIQQCINKGNLNLEVIRDCLFSEKMRLFTMPRSARAKALKEQVEHRPLAKNILGHIWAHDELWIPLIVHGETLVHALCYFALAEGLEPLLLSWLEVPEPNERSLQQVELAPHLWRGYLLLGIIGAHFWHCRTHAADSAIKVLFRTVQRKDALTEDLTDSTPIEQIPPLSNLSYRVSCAALKQELCTGNYYKTDAVLFERFSGFFARSHHPRSHSHLHQFHTADLAMYHPQKPSPHLALQLMQNEVSKAGDTREPPWEALTSRKPMQRFFQRARQLLHEGGNGADAEWVAKREQQMLAQPSRRPVEVGDRELQNAS